MKHLLTLLALLALASHADASRRGGNVSGYDPLTSPRHGFNLVTGSEDAVRQAKGIPGKRGRGGDPTPCCGGDNPGQPPRK